MNNNKILIIGANSDIACACAKQFQLLGNEVVLAGHKLEELPTDFQRIQFDVKQQNSQELLDLNVDVVLYSAGRFQPSDNWQNDQMNAEMISVNFSSAVSVLNQFANQFEKKGKGVIVGISSVAAVRGKQSTLIYGASKAGFDAYLSGLRAMLSKNGVRVLTVRPGYVATKMTQSLTLHPMLTTSPEKIAKVIVKHSLTGKRNIIYFKPIWRLIMAVIKTIPEPIFKKLNL